MVRERMDTRELGLVLGQQLLGVDDLHYGYWADDMEVSFANLPEAQRRYTQELLDALPPASEAGRVLDVGCGTGNTMQELLARGYHVDGVIPSASLARLLRERLAGLPANDCKVFECKLEDMDADAHAGSYGVILFSESFQYIPMKDSFPILRRLLAPGGRIVICDFFKTEHHHDGRAGDQAVGGGHSLARFYAEVPEHGLMLERDEDITRFMSPNFKLLNDLLMNKTRPLLETFSLYLGSRYRRSWGLLKWLFRKRWKKIDYKYLQGHRSPEVFERYKSYRLLVLRVSR